jgi:hypothetical protein
MASIVAIGSLFIIFWIFGFVLAMVMSTVQCSKQNWFSSVTEGLMWSAFPTIVYIILEFSPYMLSIFSNGVKSVFGWTGYAADQAGYDKLGLAYALVLAGLIVTTRMVHTVEVAVCKPDVGELAAFQENLMKSLKEKEAAKKRDEDLNKPTS